MYEDEVALVRELTQKLEQLRVEKGEINHRSVDDSIARRLSEVLQPSTRYTLSPPSATASSNLLSGKARQYSPHESENQTRPHITIAVGGNSISPTTSSSDFSRIPIEKSANGTSPTTTTTTTTTEKLFLALFAENSSLRQQLESTSNAYERATKANELWRGELRKRCGISVDELIEMEGDLEDEVTTTATTATMTNTNTNRTRSGAGDYGLTEADLTESGTGVRIDGKNNFSGSSSRRGRRSSRKANGTMGGSGNVHDVEEGGEDYRSRRIRIPGAISPPTSLGRDEKPSRSSAASSYYDPTSSSRYRVLGRSDSADYQSYSNSYASTSYSYSRQSGSSGAMGRLYIRTGGSNSTGASSATTTRTNLTTPNSSYPVTLPPFPSPSSFRSWTLTANDDPNAWIDEEGEDEEARLDGEREVESTGERTGEEGERSGHERNTHRSIETDQTVQDLDVHQVDSILAQSLSQARPPLTVESCFSSKSGGNLSEEEHVSSPVYFHNPSEIGTAVSSSGQQTPLSAAAMSPEERANRSRSESLVAAVALALGEMGLSRSGAQNFSHSNEVSSQE